MSVNNLMNVRRWSFKPDCRSEDLLHRDPEAPLRLLGDLRGRQGAAPRRQERQRAQHEEPRSRSGRPGRWLAPSAGLRLDRDREGLGHHRVALGLDSWRHVPVSVSVCVNGVQLHSWWLTCRLCFPRWRFFKLMTCYCHDSSTASACHPAETSSSQEVGPAFSMTGATWTDTSDAISSALCTWREGGTCRAARQPRTRLPRMTVRDHNRQGDLPKRKFQTARRGNGQRFCCPSRNLAGHLGVQLGALRPQAVQRDLRRYALSDVSYLLYTCKTYVNRKPAYGSKGSRLSP